MGHLSWAVSTACLVCHSCQLGGGSQEARRPGWSEANRALTVHLCEWPDSLLLTSWLHSPKHEPGPEAQPGFISK